MKTTFEYQGYRGSIKVSEVDNCLYGTLLDITDLVTYEAQTVADLRLEFLAAVDDYLETCRTMNKEPQKPTPRLRKKSLDRNHQTGAHL